MRGISEANSMRTVVFYTAVMAGFVWIGIAPGNAAPSSMSGIGKTNIQAATVKNIGYRRRYYRRYGYPVPFTYYPPAYGYYVPPAAYAYPPAAAYAAPQEGDYVDAPPPEANYGNAPPPENEYNEEGNYGDALPPEGDYSSAPAPQGY
jgi:hypothetical protein